MFRRSECLAPKVFYITTLGYVPNIIKIWIRNCLYHTLWTHPFLYKKCRRYHQISTLLQMPRPFVVFDRLCYLCTNKLTSSLQKKRSIVFLSKVIFNHLINTFKYKGNTLRNSLSGPSNKNKQQFHFPQIFLYRNRIWNVKLLIFIQIILMD